MLVNQLTYLVITRLAAQANVNAAAAGATAAGITTYQKAHLVFMLPHSVITVSIVTAMLPALSRLAHDGLLHRVGRDVGFTMRLAAALIIPVSAVLVVTGSSISVLLFGVGAAAPEQAVAMGRIVSVFMLGLLPFTLFYVLLRGFYAVEDTRTPFWITVGFSIAWLAMAVPSFPVASDGAGQVAVLALSYGLSYWIGMTAAWLLLRRRLGFLDSRRTLGALGRMMVAGLLAFGVMTGVNSVLSTAWTGGPTGDRWAVLVVVVAVTAAGLLAYAAGAWALRIDEVGEVWGMVRRKVVRR